MNDDNKEIASRKADTGHAEHKAARKQKARSRLSFLLLDVFLGGFLVGIVLMITLGRPVGKDPAEGSGGEAFLLIEFFWKEPNRMLTPVLVYQGNNLNRAGLASPWEQKDARDTPWVAHIPFTGMMKFDVDAKRFEKIAMDGFHPDGKILIKDPARKGFYAYLWLSKPCGGKWSVGIREVESNIDMVENAPLDISYRVRWSVAGKDQDPGKAGQQVLLRGKKAVNVNGAFDTMKLTDKKTPYINFKVNRMEGEPASYCKVSLRN